MNRLFSRKISFGERFAIGILYMFLKKYYIYKDIKKLYQIIIYNRLKLKEVIALQKNMKRNIKKPKRYKKEKGYYLSNPYSISYWMKELDRPKLYSRH